MEAKFMDNNFPLKAIGKRLHIRIIELELSRGPSPKIAACPCRRNPTSSTARFGVMKATQFARVLGVRLDWLLEGTEPKERAL